MCGLVRLFGVWLCWLVGHGGWVRGSGGVLCTHRSFRDLVTLPRWSPWPKLPPHGANKIPAAPQRLLYFDPAGMFARDLVLGELTRQWRRLPQLQLRHRHHVLDIQWRHAVAFQIWFEGWFLLEAPRRLSLLSKTLAYDKQFCLAMVQAVYCCLVPGLDVLD